MMNSQKNNLGEIMKNVFITSLVTVLFAVTLSAQPQNRGNHRAQRQLAGPEFLPGMIEQLNLTDDQKNEVMELKTAHQKHMIDLQSELKKKMVDSKSIFMQNDLNESNVMDAINEKAEMKTNIEKEKVKFWFSVYNLLDESQRQVWKKGIFQFQHLGMVGKTNHRKGKHMRKNRDKRF